MIIINARFLTQPTTGVQRYAIEISKRLRANYTEDELCFVSPKNIIHDEVADLLKVQIRGRFTGHIWEQIELPFLISKKDILLNLCNTAPLLHKKNIVTIHDIAFEVFPETYSTRFLKVYKWLIPRLAKKALKVITVSEFSKSELIKFYKLNPDKIEVVYNAVDASFSSIKDKTLSQKRYLLMVSSLNARKNLLRTLQAFELTASKYPNLKLFVIGDLRSNSFEGIDISKYKANAKISILGRVSDEDLVKYYSNAQGFLYASLYEGFGIPPLEAQACGCPVLVSNASCLPEVFKDSAIYCNPVDINSIAEGMNKLLERSSGSKLEQNALANLKRFSWGESSNKLSDLLTELNS